MIFHFKEAQYLVAEHSERFSHDFSLYGGSKRGCRGVTNDRNPPKSCRNPPESAEIRRNLPKSAEIMPESAEIRLNHAGIFEQANECIQIPSEVSGDFQSSINQHQPITLTLRLGRKQFIDY